MIKDPSKDPANLSMAYRAMLPDWQKITTLLGGTKAMRAAGELYLPRFEYETTKNYKIRLEMTTLLGMTELTLESWVGRPFAKPVEISEDTPAEVKELLDDVNLQGDSMHVFSRNWFREGIAKAYAHVAVDFPTGEAGKRTLADDRRDNLRPYLCFVPPENLIFASATVENGWEVLSHVRIRESEIVRVGFAETVIERIRVFDRVSIPGGESFVTVSVWEAEEVSKRNIVWKEIQPATRIDIDVIPVVTFYANRTGFMLGKSPLSDLADKNIEHWQSSSDQRNVLTVARFPILAQSGASPDGDSKIQLGPKKLLATTDTQGRFYYVEHGGAAINAGRQDLLDIQEQMSHYGSDFLRKKVGGETATARAIDSAEATSPLQDVSHRFNDALAQVMYLIGKWMKIDKPGTVEVTTDFGPEGADPADFQALTAARTNRDISKRRLNTELQRRGTLDRDFDHDENDRELEKEAEEFGGVPVTTDEQGEAVPIDDAQ